MLGCGRRFGGRVPVGIGRKMGMVGVVAGTRANGLVARNV